MSRDAIAACHVIGCDVGKATVTVFDTLSGRTVELANDPAVLTAFVEALPQECLIVCEATGGYECVLLAAATLAGVPAHRADARKVKAFIRSLGRPGKTDAIDARGLARYGQERHAELPRWQPAGSVLDELRTLTRCEPRNGQAMNSASIRRINANSPTSFAGSGRWTPERAIPSSRHCPRIDRAR